METLIDIWGLSLNQTILIVAVTFVVVDFFIPTDIPTHTAYFLLCILVGINMPFPFLVKILLGLLTYIGLIVFHYYVWRATVQKFVNNVIAPDKFQYGVRGTVGDTGIIREINDQKMVKVKGDLWPCRGGDDLSDGTKVKVISAEDGILNIKKEKE